MMDYALIGKDLRVKKDVSDLKMDSLFWGSVLGKNYFFASCRTDPSAAVPPVRGALSRQLQGQSVFVLGSVFVHGFCATDLSREPTRHRRLSERALRSTLPLRLPQPSLSQYVSRCQPSARLAHLRGLGDAPDQKGKRALCWRTNRGRTTTKRLRTRFDHHRSLFESLSVGTLSLHQSRDQTPYSTRPVWTDSFLYRNYRGALPRRQRLDVLMVEPGAFYVMDRGYLDFSRLHTLHQAGAYFVIRARKDLRFVRYVSQPIDPDAGLCSDHIGRLQSVLLAQGLPRQTASGPFLRHCPGSSVLFPNQSTAAPGANYLPTLQDALAARTILQVDQAASANQAFLRKLDERSQNSDLDRGERLRAGGDLEEGASTTAKFTQYFTNFKREHV